VVRCACSAEKSYKNVEGLETSEQGRCCRSSGDMGVGTGGEEWVAVKIDVDLM
jgi:hypothetical protein